MMYQMFTTDKALNTILIGKENSKWKAMLQHQKTVIVDMDDSTVMAEVAEDGTLYNVLSQSFGIKIKGDPQLFQRIHNDKQLLLNYPLSFFIVNVTQEEADELQNHYGVICLSDEHIDENNILFSLHSNKRIVEGDDRTKINWSKLLSKVKKIPSSGLIIIDRNLFTNGGSWNDAHDRLSVHGINNVRDILMELLPATFGGCYHVLIITDERSLADKNYNLNDVCQQLTRIYKDHKLRSYDISFEVMGFRDNDAIHHKESHNRRVLSNYYVMTPEHKVAVFDYRNKATITEYFPIKSAYGEGLEDDSDCPEEEIAFAFSWIKDINDSNEYGKYHFCYSIDGQELSNFQQLKNRLIKYFPQERR